MGVDLSTLVQPADTRIVLVVMDGLGGYATAERGSELEEATTPNLDQLANAFTPFMKARGYATVVIMEDDTSYSKGLGEGLNAAAALAGVTAKTVVYKRDAHDLRPQLRGLLAKKPDALIAAGVVASSSSVPCSPSA
jgi:ABC-type branched-subunit amino acid transport system substrate-binding protein